MPAGRPTDYTHEMADTICERIAEGETIRAICDSEGMPNKATLFRWLDKHPEFATKYTRAKEIQIESEAEEIIEIADDGRNDWMEKKNEDGEHIGWRENGEATRRSALRVSTRQWRAERLLPKVYGNRVSTEVTGKDGAPIETTSKTDRELAKALAAILAKGLNGTDRSKAD